jgi:hypothetical protein
MAVDAANALAVEFTAQGKSQGLIDFAGGFRAWKLLPHVEQLGSRTFGSDGEYVRPLVQGQSWLRHVHLQPRKGTRDRRDWDRNRSGYARTSNRHLIYAQHGEHILLVHFLADGTAHQVAKMRTPQDTATMYRCAQLVATWMVDRTAFNGWQEVVP